MFCSKCGARLGDSARFCSKCGTQVPASFWPVEAKRGPSEGGFDAVCACDGEVERS